MEFLNPLASSDLVLWVAQSDYGYPTVLTLHSIGMALVVGIMIVIDLRVLGIARQISFINLKRFFLIAWIGFAINACSGFLLFLANYSAFLHNTAFLTKIGLLLTAAITSYFLVREVNSNQVTASAAGKLVESARARLLAIVCLLLWLAAITSGRIVGYTLVPY